MSKTLCIVLVAGVAAIATWLIGWLAVPLAAFVAGLALCRPVLVGVGCALAWAALMAMNAAAGEIGRLSEVLAGIMGIPAIGLFTATLLFPALLGWSAASIGNAARHLRFATSRQPS